MFLNNICFATRHVLKQDMFCNKICFATRYVFQQDMPFPSIDSLISHMPPYNTL